MVRGGLGYSMRIPLRKHYRAFREFDGFDDATCERLLKRARRAQTPGAQLLRILAFLPIALFVLVIGAVWFLMMVDAADHLLRDSGRSLWALVGSFFLLLISACAPFVVLLRVTDEFRRRDLRRELERTRCAKCRYGLIGLPVENDAVKCPECGEVMPLGDLSPSAAALIRAGAE